MQLAFMQNPLISMTQGRLKNSHAKSEVKDNKSNNNAHSLLDTFSQQSPSKMPTLEDVFKNVRNYADNHENMEEYHRKLPKEKEDTLNTDDVVGIEEMNEKDLKRLKRKQSNRESARRSRMRKQAECEGLLAENMELKAEILQLRKQHEESEKVIASLQNQIEGLKK